MNYRCSVCEGRMNRWMYPPIKRYDKFGRSLAIYKCVECGNEETHPDI
ncbi:DNA-directed RNA polymerase subunit RPC12/RpoP [Methanohalophilus levihalophilus]|nr:DNA-directed RNA polymerase subunit RPC12/RpoP [Methanohalophilus levihalophilus]